MADCRPMQLQKFCKYHATDTTSLEYIDLFAEDEVEVAHLIDFKDSKMMHRDSILVLQGKKKQGKSTAAMCFVMALLAGDFNGLHAHENGCTILWIDTEMGIKETRKRFSYALQTLGMYQKGVCDRLKALSLKRVPKANGKRLEAVKMAINEVYPDFVVLDGVADLVKDFNKPEECFDALEQLGEIVEDKHIALLTLIHENRQDGNAKGHAGAATDQKAYELYSVEKKNGISTVHYLDGRGEPCEDFSFAFGEHGVPGQAPEAAFTGKSICLQLWAAIIDGLGAAEDGYTNKTLKEAHARHTGKSVSEFNRDRREAEEFGILLKEGSGKSTRYKYCFDGIPINNEHL